MSVGRIVIMIAVATLILGGGHYYLWARLVRDPAWGGRIAVIGTWALPILAGLIVVGMLMRRAPRSVSEPMGMLSYSWLGVFFLAFMLLVATDIVFLAIKAGHQLRGVPLEPERRQFFAKAFASVAGLGALGLGVAGSISVFRGALVKHVPVALKRLGKEHDGFTIVQLTDVHVGPTIGRNFIRTVVDQVNALRADVVVITGDLVDGSVADLAHHVAPLGELSARHGVFFVTGNHEYYSGAPEWIAHLETLNIRVLRNERVDLGAIELAGVDDSGAHQFGHGHGEDIPKAVSGRDHEKPLVLLAHQPRAIEEASSHNVDLQLSGHTHGGQIIPWNLFVRLQQPYVAGLFEHRGSLLYVSCGTGYWGPPMRVGAPAEITRIELKSRG